MENPIQTELILKEDVRRLLDDFAGLMKLRAVFFSADGKIIERGRNAECSAFCRFMQERRFGVAACTALDREKQRECLAAKKILTYRCHAGLGEIIAPVLFLEEVAGFLVIGQFRMDDQIPSCIQSREENDAYFALPLFAGEELRNLEHMVQVLLEYIVSKELVGYPRDLRMFKLQQYIDRHLTETLTLANAARAVACSESTLTHYLKERYQTCFSRIVMKKRIQKAQKILSEHPEWTLSVVADASGFESSFYFCRVFKELCGMTPGEYRKKR
ncbi:MAG: PocR ligand-binding domain-containing protein [Victivallaceae bacterium]|nr:PocR ligand-binding domain-containing protein [Victivallaceae bacterium]